MDSISQFTVNDTSPTVSYSTGDWTPCFTDIGCLSQSWNQSQPATPNGTSYHSTGKFGASFTLNWRGTGVLLRGTANSGVNYTILLDNNPVSHQSNPSQHILASIQNAALEDHTVQLVVVNYTWDSDFYVNYTGAVISVDNTAAGSTVSLNQSQIQYSGSWSDDGQFLRSSATGAVANTSVQGLSFFLYGATGPSSGSYSVSLAASNNSVNRQFTANYSSATLSGNTSYLNSDALLFYASDLDPTLFYNVTVTNQGGGDLFIRSDGFQVFRSKLPPQTPSSATSSMSDTPKSTIVAIALGALLFLVIAALFLFYLFIYQPRNRRYREEFDALRAKAEEERSANTIMQLEEARISQSSSYRRRLARIISMIAPTEMNKRPSWKIDSRQHQPSPLSPVSTHKSDYILDISPRPREIRIDRRTVRYYDEPSIGEMPTSALESQPQELTDARSEENGLILHNRPKSSPDATIPVSPSISSGERTQSRYHRSQRSSQLLSGRFSFPFSISFPYFRGRSTEDGNEEVRNERRSRTDHVRIEGGHGSDGQGSDDTSLSTIVFAEIPKVMPPSEDVKEKVWDVRHSVKSFVSGLSGVGKRWYNARANAKAGEVIYPFVSISSTTPTQQRALSAGGVDGGLLIIERDRKGTAGDALDQVENLGEDGPAGTDITPLSYVTDDFPQGVVSEPEDSADGYEELSPPPSPPPQQQESSFAFPSHPYAAAALLSDPEAQSRMNVSELQNASSEGPRQRPLTTPAPAKVGFRDLPVKPKVPHPILVPSRTRPHTTSGPVSPFITSHGTTPTSGRAIRALPPLPIPTVPVPLTPKQNVQIASSSAKHASESHKPPLTTRSAVQDDAVSLPPPYNSSKHSQSSQRASASGNSSLKTPFLSMREISPFQVDFPFMDYEQNQDENKTNPSSKSPATARTRPTLEIPPSSARVPHLSAAAITPHTARSTAQCSFLDFATNSSSSHKASTREKTEPSPESEAESIVQTLPILPMRSSGEPSGEEDKEEDLDDHSRRTFGQKHRSSFYYNSADNMSLPSPSASSFTHQSYRTNQSFQTGQSQEVQRLSSQPSQKRQRASWRTTFGGRIEGDIPEETTPSDSSPPSPKPLPKSSSEPITHDVIQCERRESCMTTSSSGHATHIHPFSVCLSPHSQYASQTQVVEQQPTSPGSNENISVSSPIQFRAGGIRRTSSGDVQPVVSHRRPTHGRHDGSGSTNDSGDLRHLHQPRHPFSIP